MTAWSLSTVQEAQSSGQWSKMQNMPAPTSFPNWENMQKCRGVIQSRFPWLLGTRCATFFVAWILMDKRKINIWRSSLIVHPPCQKTRILAPEKPLHFDGRSRRFIRIWTRHRWAPMIATSVDFQENITFHKSPHDTFN